MGLGGLVYWRLLVILIALLFGSSEPRPRDVPDFHYDDPEYDFGITERFHRPRGYPYNKFNKRIYGGPTYELAEEYDPHVIEAREVGPYAQEFPPVFHLPYVPEEDQSDVRPKVVRLAAADNSIFRDYIHYVSHGPPNHQVGGSSEDFLREKLT